MTNVQALDSDGVIFVRHRVGDPIADVPSKQFGPRPAEPTNICLACRAHFKAGDFSVLVPLGPGPDEEGQAKAAAGRWYNAVAVEIHTSCAGFASFFDEAEPEHPLAWEDPL